MVNSSREAQFVGAIFFVSWLATAIVAALLAWREPTPLALAWAVGLALTALLVPLSLPRLARRGFPVALFLSLAVLNALLLLPEFSLRLAGFHYAPGIQFGWPRPEHFSSFVIDPDLFWRMDPADPHVNSLGFPDGEIERPKPDGVERLLFLGDSCLAQGIPRLVEAELGRRLPQREIDGAVLAVPGYSSHQGRAAAARYGLDLEADLAVVYFGWNDHWLARGPTDAERTVSVGSVARSELYRKLRILQASDRLLRHLKGSGGDDRGGVTAGRYRVPIDRYEANLVGIVAQFSEAGIPVLLVTAPSSHAELGVPKYLVDAQMIEDVDTAVRVHREYNQVVRKVARSTGATLVDLEVELAGLPEPRKVFTADGIHFTNAGLQRVGKRIARAAQAQLEGRRRSGGAR